MMNKEKSEWFRWKVIVVLTILGLILTALGLFLGYTISNFNKVNIKDSRLINSPIIQQSNNISVDYENRGLTYETIYGEDFSGKDGDKNRTKYIGNVTISQVYYSGIYLSEGVSWYQKDGYLILYDETFDDVIINIGY